MRTPRNPFGRERATGVRVLATLGVLGVVGALGTLGTYSLWTSNATASQTIGSGTVTIALGGASPLVNTLTTGASNVAPGDTIARPVDLSNTGSIGLASITLTRAATSSSLLDSDPTNGLQLTVQSCSVAWTGTAPGPYTCSGTTTSIVASTPVVGGPTTLPGLNSLGTGPTAVDHLLVTLTLPTASNNTTQNQSSTIQYTFTGTQRAGTNK